MKMTRNNDMEEPRDLPRVPEEPGYRLDPDGPGGKTEHAWSPTGTEDPAFT